MIPGDFTTMPPDRTYNFILTNPPYVRHHHLDRDHKERLKVMVADRFRRDISGLAGLYAHFLLLCDAWMAPGGLALWLIPSEFMDVNYGSAIKSYLNDNVKLLHIHRYRPSDVQFCDAMVTSAIVVFEKAPPSSDHQVRLSLGGPITRPDATEMVPLDVLRLARKWTGLARGPAPDAGPSHTLGDLFAIKRGIATGANGFFILDRQEARARRIPDEFLRPILPSSRHLTVAVIEAEPDGYPRLARSLAIIDCDLPGPVIQERYPAFWEYLESGKAMGVHAGYLASRRTPWYSQEKCAAGSLPLHLYGPCEGRRQSVPLLLEPIPGDGGERLPVALSSRRLQGRSRRPAGPLSDRVRLAPIAQRCAPEQGGGASTAAACTSWSRKNSPTSPPTSSPGSSRRGRRRGKGTWR